MNLLVLTYHYFHSDKPSGIKEEDHPFSMHRDDFNNHCRQLSESTCDLVRPADLEGGPRLQSAAERQILLTIDDGHASVEEYALAPLQKHNLTAVINVIPGLVGEKHYLNWSSLRHLATGGFSIQSHSMTHVNLARLDRDRLYDELRRSKRAIEDSIGAPVNMLTVPMGRINARVVDCALDIGYSVIMTSYTGINTKPGDFTALKRFQVKDHVKSLPLDDYYSPFSSQRIIGAAKNMVKKLRTVL